MISQPRCRAKFHGIFKQAQRQSRDGRRFFLVGGYEQLVGNQIARLSACGVVIVSEFLSPNFDLNSSTVRNVLRRWIAHGDAAAVWLTQPSTSSSAACLLKTSSKRCWFLRGAPPQYGQSVFQALRQRCLWLPASTSGYVCFWLTVQETLYAVLRQCSGALEAGSTLSQLWSRLLLFW